MWRIDRQNRSTSATCARDEETKKDRNLTEWQTGYSPTPTTSSDRNTVWRGRWSYGIGHKFQVSSTWAERLPSRKGSKFGWSQLGQWLIHVQQPYSARPWLYRRPTGVSLGPCYILHLRCRSLTASLSPLRLLMTAKSHGIYAAAWEAVILINGRVHQKLPY